MNIVETVNRFRRSKGSDKASIAVVGIGIVAVMTIGYFLFWADLFPGGFAWDMFSGILVTLLIVAMIRKSWLRRTSPHAVSSAPGESPVRDMLVEPNALPASQSDDRAPEQMPEEAPSLEKKRISAVEDEMERRERRIFKRSAIHATSREKVKAAEHKFGIYIPKSLILQDDEIVTRARRLHWMKMALPGAVFVATTMLYFYVMDGLAGQLALQIIILVASSAIILYKYYRIAREIITSITTVQYLMTLFVLLIAGVILRFQLRDWGLWLWDRLRTLFGWIFWDIGHMMITLAVMAGVLFISEVVLWLANPALATNKRLIITRGLGIFVTKSAALKSITDQEMKTVAFFNFGTIEIETPGQNQSITRVPYFPHDFYASLRGGVDAGETAPE